MDFVTFLPMLVMIIPGLLVLQLINREIFPDLWRWGRKIWRLVKGGGVLSDRTIMEEMKSGNIVIHPFEKSQLSSCSYDVTLGKHYFAPHPRVGYFNPWNKNHVRDYWGISEIASEVSCRESEELTGLPRGTSYITIGPGKSILAHTQEFIGGKNYITTMMKARSSMGRSNLTICRDAGWGDIGFVNRWSMIITNNSMADLILPVGSRIAQIIFFYTDTPDHIYQGKYHDPQQKLSETMQKWSPDDLLPRLHLDN